MTNDQNGGQEERPEIKHPTREGWLVALNEKLDELFVKAGQATRPKMRVACGFPSTRARVNPKNSYRIGECWHAEKSADDTHEIFISPTLDDVFDVAATLVHERCHAHLPQGTMHKAPFARLAKQVGLTGKPTRTEIGPALEKWLGSIFEELGPYPHAALDTRGGRKQTTRLLKVICTQCDCVIRMTRVWLESVGAPTCGCGAPMEAVYSGDEARFKLRTTEQLIHFSLDDDRFELQFMKRRGNVKWHVLDHAAERSGSNVVPRLTPCGDRDHCLDVIDALNEGLYTYDTLHEMLDRYEDDVDYIPDDEYEDLDNPEDAKDEEYEDQYPSILEEESPFIESGTGEDFDWQQTIRQRQQGE